MNLKRIITLIFFFISKSYILVAQINDADYNRIMWGNDVKEAKITKIPEKWNKESAVYLYLKEVYKYRKQSMNNAINEDIYYRSRIILLDQTAINEYSEMSMNKIRNNMWGRDANYLGIKIIKPNGDIRTITEYDFVEVKSKESGYQTQRTMKLALPNLAIGDIIDTYYVSINSYTTTSGSLDIQFNPVSKLLQAEYPILYGELIVKPERKTYFNAKSYNGAPEPKIVKDGKWDNYIYQYADIEKINIDQMVFPYREYPNIIYQITMTSKLNKLNRFDFLGDPAKIKSEVKDDEIRSLLLKIADNNLLDGYSLTMQDQCYRNIKKNLSKKYSESEIAINAFYFLRHYLYFKYYNYFGQLMPMYSYISDYMFIKALSNVLSKFNIKHEIGLVADRQYAKNNNVIISSQLIPFIRLNNQDSTIITFPTNNSTFGEYLLTCEGNKAMILNKTSTSAKNPEFLYETMEISSAKNNISIDTIFVNLDDLVDSKISLTENYYIKGSNKEIYYYLVNPYFSTYSNEVDEYANLFSYKQSDLKFIEENQEYFEKYKDEYLAKRHNNLINQITVSQSVDKIEFDTINVFGMGRWSDNDTLKYQLKYSYKSGIKSAGKYYLVSIGKFIGQNKEFSKEEIDRKVNIYNTSPYEYNWVIIMNIPKNYEIENIDNLQFSIDNSEGSFSSKAIIDGNRLIVNVKKVYKKNYNPVEKWPEVLEFLQAASDFTQKQILLTPVE